jgi:hypothetical protein
MSERTSAIYISYQNAKIARLVAKAMKKIDETVTADALVDDILTEYFRKTQDELVDYLESFEDGAEGKVKL